MSGGVFCACRPHPKFAHWRVVQRHCNHSTFNGSRRTWSRYSEIRCTACGHFWRTKASYVERLPDITEQELLAP